MCQCHRLLEQPGFTSFTAADAHILEVMNQRGQNSPRMDAAHKRVIGNDKQEIEEELQAGGITWRAGPFGPARLVIPPPLW